MRVLEIQIDDFRVLETVKMEPAENVSLVLGRNGAGKTSIIEAMYVAGRGSSFRHREIKPWIREGQKAAKVFVRTQGSVGGEHRIGVLQQRASKVIKVDGVIMQRRSQLAGVLPLQLITPSSHDLIERGPGVRRRFLDWGLFHVEPGFRETALRYRRALNQRNNALKKNDNSFGAWDELLARHGEAIDRLRQSLLPDLRANLNEELEALGLKEQVELDVVLGWEEKGGLLEALSRARESDRVRGSTGQGAHRTTLTIKIDGVQVERRLSRGQQKLLVYSLMFALTRVLAQRDVEKPVLLVDDLPAELDVLNQERVIYRTLELGLQAIITATHVQQNWENLPVQVFHVEQGQVRAY